MKLSECRHGLLVQKEDATIGMIIGLSENRCSEAIPLIQWQTGATYPCHHSNIKLYEE